MYILDYNLSVMEEKKIIVRSCQYCPYMESEYGGENHDGESLMICMATKPKNINGDQSWDAIMPFPEWCPLKNN